MDFNAFSANSVQNMWAIILISEISDLHYCTGIVPLIKH